MLHCKFKEADITYQLPVALIASPPNWINLDYEYWGLIYFKSYLIGFVCNVIALHNSSGQQHVHIFQSMRRITNYNSTNSVRRSRHSIELRLSPGVGNPLGYSLIQPTPAPGQS